MTIGQFSQLYICIFFHRKYSKE